MPRRQLGRHLRELRQRARFTLVASAKALEWSETKIWRIETGQVASRSLDVEQMCRIYGADRATTKGLMGLAKETKARGWWHAYGDVIPEGFDVYVGLEEAAVTLDIFHSILIPGLFQTEDYAREAIRVNAPGLSDEALEGRVRLRVARQTLVTRKTDPPAFRIVLDEPVLWRPVGGHRIMAAQLAHLVWVTRLPSVTLRIASVASGLHPGVATGPFNLLRFPVTGDGRELEPPTVYSDGFTGGLYLDKPRELEAYDAAFQSIWATALDEQASLHLLDEVARSHESHA